MDVVYPLPFTKAIGQEAWFDEKRDDTLGKTGIERKVIGKELAHEGAERNIVIVIFLATAGAVIVYRIKGKTTVEALLRFSPNFQRSGICYENTQISVDYQCIDKAPQFKLGLLGAVFFQEEICFFIAQGFGLLPVFTGFRIA